MDPSESDFYTRKLEHITRDYDRALSALLKFGDHRNSVRQWNITVIVAYLGLVRACVDNSTAIPILPLLGAIYLFWIMEAFVKAEMYFYQEYTLNEVDRLFSKEDTLSSKKEDEPSSKDEADSFNGLIKRYQFADARNKSGGKKWQGKGGRLHRFSRGLVNCQTVVFYMLPLFVLAVWYSPSWGELTFSVPLFGVLLLPAFLFLFGGSIYWLKYHKNE